MCRTGTTCSYWGKCECEDPSKTGDSCDECKNPAKKGDLCDQCVNPLKTGWFCSLCVDPLKTGEDCERCLDPQTTGDSCDECVKTYKKGPGCIACVNPVMAGLLCNELAPNDCHLATNQLILDAPKGFEAVYACGMPCFGLGLRCIQRCLYDDVGLTAGCACCVSNWIDCSLKYCGPTCYIDADGPDCQACVTQNCPPSYDECVGCTTSHQSFK
ncbi:MAG: hypothetical protein IV100_15555 [Myxococcales bacterium]|nr:hypothetical protein [Myxococcales bacterium]